ITGLCCAGSAHSRAPGIDLAGGVDHPDDAGRTRQVELATADLRPRMNDDRHAENHGDEQDTDIAPRGSGKEDETRKIIVGGDEGEDKGTWQISWSIGYDMSFRIV